MKISIIGAAGTLGSCAAFNIIIHKMASELVLIDPWKDGLKAHWIDLNTAVTWQNIRVRMGEYEDMAGSEIVVVTAGAPSGMISSRKELLPANLPIIRENAARINRLCPKAIVITVTNPVDPLNYAMYLIGPKKDRRKYIGYSLNDTFRFRNMVALDLGVRPSRVDGVVIGEHDLSQVLVFSSLRLDGKPLSIDEDFKRRIRAQAANTLKELESLQPKRATGWTSAVGIVAIIRSIIDDVGEIIPCNAVLDGEYGYRGLSMTVPVVIGRDGIRRIQEIDLLPEEKEGLANSVQTLLPSMRTVEENLGISLKQ
jgi:malate dehydrogenase